MCKIFKYFMTIALCLIVGVGFAANRVVPFTEAQKLATSKSILTVGHLDYPPFYEISNGKLKGIDAEVVREVAKRIKINKVVFVQFNSLKELTAALDKGNIDLIANGFFSTPERKQQYLMTIPYYINGGLGFLYLKGQNNFRTAKDLKGYRVGVLENSYPHLYWLPQNGISSSEVKVYPTAQELISALKNKEIDIVVNNYTFCRYQATNNNQGQTPMITYLVQPFYVAFMLRKSNTALQESLNQALLSMWKDGSLYAIELKYLPPIGINPKKEYFPINSR